MSDMQNEELKSIGERMMAQDNRATEYPLFVIQNKVKVYREDGEERARKEDYDRSYCDACTKLADDGEVPEDCDECPSDCFYQFDWEYQFDLRAGVFFTEKACHDHITANHYHYNEPRSYAICAWRNPEMVAVMQHLIELTGKEIPSQYR